MDEKRKQAVDAVLSHEMTQMEAAAAFGISRNTVGRWIREFQKSAGQSFMVSKGGRPQVCLPQNLLALLADTPPDIPLWTVKTVASVLPQAVSAKTVTRLLASMGIVQPRIHLPADASFTSIHKRANKWGAKLFWYREAILENSAFIASIAVAPRGDIAFMLSKQPADHPFSAFLSRLLMHTKGKPFYLLVPAEEYETEFDRWKDNNPSTGCKVVQYIPPQGCPPDFFPAELQSLCSKTF